MSKGWPVSWQFFTNFVEPTQSILQVHSLSVRLMSSLRCGTNVFTLEPLPLDSLSRRQRSTDFRAPRAGTGDESRDRRLARLRYDVGITQGRADLGVTDLGRLGGAVTGDRLDEGNDLVGCRARVEAFRGSVDRWRAMAGVISASRSR